MKPQALLASPALLTLLAAPFCFGAEVSSLEADFRNPPVSACPYVWWHWLGSNFSKEGITKDLEAMKASGIGGATIFNISSSVNESHAPTLNNPWPDQTYRSPKYWEALRHAAAEAKRLGLEIGLHNTVGYSTTGGPWIDEERSMQRLVWSTARAEGGKSVSVKLPVPALVADEGWGKTGRKISFFRDVAVLAVPQREGTLAPSDIVVLNSAPAADGTLTWNAPPGSWTLYRLGHCSTGRPPHPVPDDVIGKTLEADKMSLEQTRFHWETVIGPVKEHLGDLYGDSFRHYLIDSFEAGNQNWTPRFREEFLKRKGYDPLPWLATMGPPVTGKKDKAEHTLGSVEQTARFEWDYRDLSHTLFQENGWKTAAELMRKNGVGLQFEPYGGQFDSIAGAAVADLPMVEFWSGKIPDPNDAIVGAARAAGRRVVGAEAFTGAPGNSKWNETPAFLKSAADGAFAGGVNRLVLHHWVHQPFDDRYQPGFGMGWWGTHFNRHQTWFEPGKEFFRYLGRAQALMQRGETPVAHLSVGASQAGGDAVALRDFLDGAKVADGQVVLPSGRRYRLLHLPHSGQMLPETAEKLEGLLNAGATLVSPKPSRSPSLTGYPACDEKVRAIAARVWGDSRDGQRKFGRGTLFPKGDLAAARQALGLEDSFRVVRSEGVKARADHRAEGTANWFFVANLDAKPARFTGSFAVNGLQPELWDAETASITPAPLWKTAGGRTEVDLELGGTKSVIVMFRSPAKPGERLAAIEGAGWSLMPSANGPARLETSTAAKGMLRFTSGQTKPFDLAPPAPVSVSGPWKVAFAPKLSAPFTREFPSLINFGNETDLVLRHFSGTATYTVAFEVQPELLKADRRVSLDLGDVCDLATVSLNGKDLGVWWHQPFSRDVTEALRPGTNTFTVAVTNTWNNLLVGDEQHPADFEWGNDRGGNGRSLKGYPDWFLQNKPRPVSERKGFVVWHYHRKDSPLLPAGLIGPVRLIPKASIPVQP